MAKVSKASPQSESEISALKLRIAELETALDRARSHAEVPGTTRGHYSEAHLWNILEAIPMHIGIHDRDMTVRYVNRTIDHIPIDRVLGSSPLAWVATRDQAHLKRAFGTLFETDQVQALEIADGRGHKWNLLLAPLRDGDGRRQALSCAVEITERKRLEAQLRQAQKVESLGTLAGAVAHDFNNLLVAILGNADLGTRWAAERRDPSPCFNNIREASERAAALCRQMLAYSGRERTTLAPQDLNDVVRRMTQLMRAAVSSRIEVDFALLDALPGIQGDDSQLGQVIMNLITNAAEAIEPGHGRIVLRTDVVEVDNPEHDYLPGSPLPGRHVMLEVTDDGRGMDGPTRSMVFDPFFTSKESGHGLGLSAVLGIVRSHGAAIRVRSAVGEGTTFTVLFPTLRRSGAPSRKTRTRRASSPGYGSVMVVDDEAGVRELASEVLREEGYHVIEAENGEQALSRWEESGGQVRAVLLDVTMPRRDGLSTLRELRKREPKLPVILSSGGHMDAEQGSNDHYLSFLGKPYTIEALLRTVEDALDMK